ncbi:MAG: APC family permease [Chthonomonadaceae bacterium]|nr:APC family permease [Chthonomonadaceae bacterium]
MSQSVQRPSLLRRVKHVLFGTPIHSSQAHHERLGIATGLPVFASDALSSSAYATEAILGVLILGAASMTGLQLWIALGISLLIAIVAWSYWQTIHAYPSGGGSYIVASDNLGPRAGMFAGAALLIDYILTVSVSVAAGVAALISAFPALHAYLVPLGIAFTTLIAIMNLRGVRESGALFSLPTYGFLVSIFVMMGFALFKFLTTPQAEQTIVGEPGAIGSEAHLPFLFLLTRAFAAGCTALTGIEAVSDGAPAFRKPEAQNASRTLLIMAVLLTTLVLGIGFFSLHIPRLELFAAKNPEYSTVLSQIAAWAFGGTKTIGFYIVQFATAAILILAANTAFADFPRLTSFLARDGYLPRYLARQGDRLVFQNGIILLAVAASILIWIYHGELDLLLPLYAVGVFSAFTLSQSGMVVHWRKDKTAKHTLSLSINFIGAVLTGVVAVVLLVTKFSEGAWLILVLCSILYYVFAAIKKRYESITRQLTANLKPARALPATSVLVLVPRIHAGVIQAVSYAQTLSANSRGLHVTLNPAGIESLKNEWASLVDGVPLIILDSPYRSLLDPVLEYVDAMLEENPDQVLNVVIPEAVPTKWLHRLLQENLAFQLKYALGTRKNVVVTNVRYFLD